MNHLAAWLIIASALYCRPREQTMQWLPMAQQYDVPAEYILALIYAESKGDQYATGDHGHSIGLFQLNDVFGGKGSGYTVEQRYDPELQFEIMMPSIKKAYYVGRSYGYDGTYLAAFIGRAAEVSVPENMWVYGWAYDCLLPELNRLQRTHIR